MVIFVMGYSANNNPMIVAVAARALACPAARVNAGILAGKPGTSTLFGDDLI